MIPTDHDKDEDNNNADGNVTEHPRRLGREWAPPKRFEDHEVYVTVEEEDEFMLIGGPVENCHFFKLPLDQFWVAQFTQIALNMIPVKFGWKKMSTSLPAVPPKFTFFVY